MDNLNLKDLKLSEEDSRDITDKLLKAIKENKTPKNNLNIRTE